MDPERKAFFVLLVLIVAGLVTYVAFLNPLLGTALLVGVGVALFLHQVLG
ncbi:hypothetical protein I5Q34_13680 [Streptomyces sp. AV19]|nr:hypothetical protein [Streptomyces sp. AV19]MBH1935310.1 hypothetical protein [Streptomyces sp. AV19]MDG4531195.1 hypothetical protein [Streptomyces sp. AV19]